MGIAQTHFEDFDYFCIIRVSPSCQYPHHQKKRWDNQRNDLETCKMALHSQCDEVLLVEAAGEAVLIQEYIRALCGKSIHTPKYQSKLPESHNRINHDKKNR